ncbi:MAG: hypothetical protein AAGA58_09905 [Verrucomicrobiota bacterium]
MRQRFVGFPEIGLLSIAGSGGSWWIYRPEELVSDSDSRSFYESVRQTDSSIRIDAYPVDSDITLAWIENYGGPSGLLNYGILTSRYEIRVVRNHLLWTAIYLFNHIRNTRIRYRMWDWNITPRTEQVEVSKPDPAAS